MVRSGRATAKWSVALVVLLAAPSVTGDEIRTAAGARYASVRLEDVQQGRLHFRDVQGRLLTRAITDLGTLSITGWEAFNRAEQLLAERQYRLAVRAYEAILRSVEQAGPDTGRPRHRRELVLARLLAACDGEGRFDRAVECFILLCAAWGEGAAGLEPRNVPARESAFHAAAVERLTAAIRDQPRAGAGELLRRYRDQLTATPTTQVVSRSATTSHAKPAVRPSRDAGAADARLRQIAAWVETGRCEQARPAIEEALRSEPVDRLAPWYYWHGRCLEAAAQGDEAAFRAALAYMRVAVHYPEDAHVAECLYRAAAIHKQAGRSNRVAPLLAEALRRSPGEEIRRRCEALLQSTSRPAAD